MKEHTVKTYSFDELDQAAQDKALCDYIDFRIETYDPESDVESDNLKRAVADADRMRTPWFVGQYAYEYCREEFIADIKANDYEYYANGEVFNFKGVG